MSMVFTENENNDIYLTPDNKLAIRNDLQAALQGAQAAMEIQLNEAIYAQKNGIPNESIVWSGNPNIPKFEFFARKQIKKVNGVTDIVDFSAVAVDDVLQYQATIKTIYGAGDINGII